MLGKALLIFLISFWAIVQKCEQSVPLTLFDR